MTSPVLVAPYEPAPEQRDDHRDELVLAALAAFFASQAAIGAVLLPSDLVQALVSVGAALKPARAAGKLALSVPLTGRSRHGAPTVPDNWMEPDGPATPSMARRAAADEPLMRARYVLNAARRLTAHLVDGTFLPGLRAERRHLVAHVTAGRNRRAAARRLDDVAARSGPFLKWDATLDEATTPDCWALHGTVFTIDNPPGIRWPLN